MLAGVRCRWRSGDNTEEIYSVEECLSCAATGANPCGYPYPTLALMFRERNPDVVQCSATMFGGCAREQGIKKHVDYTLNPEQVYTRMFGSAVHFALEKGSAPAEPHLQVEQRFSRKIVLLDERVMIVTAALDALYSAEGSTNVRIKDYKVVESITDSALMRKLAWYIPQFSIQRWILEGCGRHVEDIELVFLTHKGKRNINLYPDGEPEFPDARIWSLERTEEFLREKGPALLSSLESIETLAPPLTEGTWKCHRCDVLAQCTALYGKPIPAMWVQRKKEA